MTYQKIILASGPVIVEDNKVLLNQSSGDDFWKFCGGKPLESESLQETSQRRVMEEMGLVTEIINPEPYIMYVTKEKNGETKDIMLVHWLSKRQGDIVSGPDVDKWDWFELDKLPESLAPNILPTLKHFEFIK